MTENKSEIIRLGVRLIGVPAAFYFMGVLLSYLFSHVDPLHTMAYGMQIAAFCTFIWRIDKLLKTYHDKKYGIIKAIIEQLKSKDGKGLVIEAKYSSGGSTANIQIETQIVGDTNATLLVHDKRLNRLERAVNELPKQVDQKVSKTKKEMEEVDEEKMQIFKTTLGPEFVAVIWLLIAAATFLGTHIHG